MNLSMQEGGATLSLSMQEGGAILSHQERETTLGRRGCFIEP